jgi:hypothetical protein
MPAAARSSLLRPERRRPHTPIDLPCVDFQRDAVERTHTLKPLVRNLGAPWAGFHTLRHTYASLQLAHGVTSSSSHEPLATTRPRSRWRSTRTCCRRGGAALDLDLVLKGRLDERSQSGNAAEQGAMRMGDPVEIRRRMRRLLERVDRRDAYGKLLAEGHVVANENGLEDPDAWRAELRRQARADRIRLRTGRSQGIVWAVVHERRSAERDTEQDRYGNAMQVVVPQAVAHRHEPTVLVRDADEVLLGCERCKALGYTEAGEQLVSGGELFEQDCSHDSPPRTTGLSLFYGTGILE